MDLNEMTDQQFVAYMTGYVLMQIGKGDFQGAMWFFYQNTSQRISDKLQTQKEVQNNKILREKVERIVRSEVGPNNTRYIMDKFDKEFKNVV